MTELDLYKFLHNENGCEPEMHWHPKDDTGNNEDQLIVFIHPGWIDTFAKLIGDDLLSDGDVECHIIANGYICVDLVPICEIFEFDPKEFLATTEGGQ